MEELVKTCKSCKTGIVILFSLRELNEDICPTCLICLKNDINTNFWIDSEDLNELLDINPCSNFQHNTRVVTECSNAPDRFREQLKRFKEVITDVK